MLKVESNPLFLTKSRNTPSAAGLRQMLPRHTKSTEKGFASALAAAGGIGGGGEDIEEQTEGSEPRLGLGARGDRGVELRRGENRGAAGEEGREENGERRERKRAEWQKGK